jgi:hypothetical protein
MIRTTLPLVAALVLLASCASAPEPTGPLADAALARARWEAGRPGDYEFDTQRHCFCVTEAVLPVTVAVRGGRIASVRSRADGTPLPVDGGPGWYTIEDLFGMIEQAARAGRSRLEVTYHPAGYPAEVTIGELAADAGVRYTVSAVRPLD